MRVLILVLVLLFFLLLLVLPAGCVELNLWFGVLCVCVGVGVLG